MKVNSILSISLILLILFSCETATNNQYKKDIIGEWKFVKTIDLRKDKRKFEIIKLLGRYPHGYNFSTDNNCENKRGYFKRIKGKQGDEDKTIYMGNKTRYKIENESLMILNPYDYKWDTEKIVSITKDTLTLESSDSLIEKYAKINYKINPNENYDKIIVSSSSCCGSCPITNISLDSKGEILFLGEYNTTRDGYFSSRITKSEYKNIETTFKKANVLRLNNNYHEGSIGPPTITVTFIKDRKIVKSISDHGNQSSTEFIWAYSPILYLYQSLKLNPVKIENPDLLNLGNWFEKGGYSCSLTSSETYYLTTEILKGLKVSKDIKTDFKMYCFDKNHREIPIYTDGRYFRIGLNTIDIGYNFIKINNLQNKFTKGRSKL
ncbi:MAG: DUF6438 domain-containing protein [Leadbetterella sp.]